MAENYNYDLIKTMVLTALGYGLYKAYKYVERLRSEPIVIGQSIENANKVLTIDIPEFWVAYNPGDTAESVTEKYKPNISLKNNKWLLTFKPIKANVGGLSVDYTPDSIQLPLIPSLSQAELAIRLAPTIKSTSSPVGWNIKFPKFAITA